MSNELADCIRRNLNRYFRDLDGEAPNAIYDMVIASVEPPMLEVVMKQAKGNQTVAAEMLGISRSTLRRKLAQYNLDNPS
jgi:Fis family transcriptional regulator